MTSQTWRIVFLGTPDFAGPSLQALASSEDTIDLIICQPDRPQGRGRRLCPPPIKVMAQELGLPVAQPEKIRNSPLVSQIENLRPDLLVVVAFGQILPAALLTIPRVGVLNVHPSLLPAYRGPAPINWAVINGETQTGVTTMFLDEGVDTGPTLLARKIDIHETETAGELSNRLAVIGADLLLETIAGLKNGAVIPRPQPEEGASRGRLLTKSDGLLNWKRPAIELAAQVRGLDPWPGAYTIFSRQTLKVFGAKTGPGRGEPGQILALDDGRLHVATSQGSLALAELQLGGKKRQPAGQFWHGQRLSPSNFFGR